MPTAERRHRHVAVEGEGVGLIFVSSCDDLRGVFSQRHTNGVQSETYGTASHVYSGEGSHMCWTKAAFANKPEHQCKAGLPETVAPVRVLLADDNEDSRYVMGSILRLSPGATVVAEASDGQAAIAGVREVHPDFVLIDRVMPVMDGLEATRRIKQEWPDLKVLVVTSLYGDDSRRAALAAGADGFLDKWDIATDLVPTILRLARGSHRL